MSEQDRCLGCGKEPEHDADDSDARYTGLDFELTGGAVKTLSDLPRTGWLCFDCWIGGMVWAARQRHHLEQSPVYDAALDKVLT